MRSIYFADEPASETDNVSVEPEDAVMDSRGFLGFAILFFVIYAMTPRPVLYAAVVKWVSQIY